MSKKLVIGGSAAVVSLFGAAAFFGDQLLQEREAMDERTALISEAVERLSSSCKLQGETPTFCGSEDIPTKPYGASIFGLEMGGQRVVVAGKKVKGTGFLNGEFGEVSCETFQYTTVPLAQDENAFISYDQINKRTKDSPENCKMLLQELGL
ncbi:MAG: hypothetical protein R3E13_00495 [Alphaproteobacteria bacterium]